MDNSELRRLAAEAEEDIGAPIQGIFEVIYKALQRAVKAERERCAKIAEQYVGPNEDEAELIGQPWKTIAKRIREAH